MEGETKKFGTIGWAVKQLHNGSRVRRRGWSSLKTWVAYIPPGAAQLPNKMADGYPTGPMLVLRTSDDEIAQWTCATADLLATDWEMVGGVNDGAQG